MCSIKMKYWKLMKKVLGTIFISVFLLFVYHSFTAEVHDRKCYTDLDSKCHENYSVLKGHGSYYCLQRPVFFVETSTSDVLTIRQACAIESTSYHNPSLQVIVLMTSTKLLNLNHALMKSLTNISNIQIVRIDIDELVCGTPIWEWFMSGKWKKSQWKASHLSDALRFFLMWKYGGIYLDMDVVVLRSLEHLRNAAVTEDWDRVASGILFFDKGHELMKRCMFDFSEKYDSSNFVANGPGIITHNIRTYCDNNRIGKISGADCNVDIHPPEAAFPIPYDKWHDYFTPSSMNELKIKFNSSYLIHVWNKFSKGAKLIIGSNSLYELAMKEHCPSVYKYAKVIGYG